MRSVELGSGGGMRLESLPGAAGFYESLGMWSNSRTGQRKGNLIYALEPETGEQLLAEIKQQGIVEL